MPRRGPAAPGMALLLVALLGGGALWWGTDGGRALTAEAARRLDIATNPRALPNVVLKDQRGEELSLADYRGGPLLMEFIYATCPDLCLTLGTAFERIDSTAPGAVRLLSISFDPRDEVEQLGWFAERHGAAPPRWRVAGVTEDAARAALVRQAGVVVIPDGIGGFVHNGGLYLVDRQGRLTHVFDPEDVAGALAALEADAP